MLMLRSKRYVKNGNIFNRERKICIMKTEMKKEKQNVFSEPLTEREKQVMKEIAELKEANEILKDAMSFFVKDRRK